MSDPHLGYGQQSEATIDQVNIWMRSTPWYQQQMRAWGQDPGHPNLSESQSQQILKAAQANGVVVDEGNMEVDDHGNFNPIGHKLRNTLIVAGIAAATIATMGATGAFSGAAGGAGAGASSGAGAAAAGGAGGASVGASAAGTGSILGAANSVYNALKTGGSFLNDASQLTSALSKGRADGRVAEANVNNQYDRTAADLYRAQLEANTAKNNYGLNATTGQNTFALGRVNAGNSLAQTDLDRRKYALAAPGARAGNAVRGDILSSAHDVAISGTALPPVQFSGGLHPDMFSADTRALGSNMTAQARREQEAGDHFDPLPDLPDYVAPPAYKDGPAAPTPTPLPQATGTDTILNSASTLGSLASLLSTLPYKKKPVPGVTDQPNDDNGWG